MKCPHCREEIKQGANICPCCLRKINYYSLAEQLSSQRKPILKECIYWAIGTGTLFAVGYCLFSFPSFHFDRDFIALVAAGLIFGFLMPFMSFPDND
jgi:hypothetical protein